MVVLMLMLDEQSFQLLGYEQNLEMLIMIRELERRCDGGLSKKENEHVFSTEILVMMNFHAVESPRLCGRANQSQLDYIPKLAY